MDKHVKFLLGEQTKFLFKVDQRSHLSSNELAKLVGVVSRSYRDWKRGKLNISLRAAEILSKRFKVALPEKKDVLVARWERVRKEASQKGGKARFKRHGSPGTLEGRRRGGKKALRILRERGIIPWTKRYELPDGLSCELAEYVGILLGDGGLTLSQVQITLNSEADRGYVPFVVSLGKRLFDVDPGIIKRRDSKVVIIYYSGVKLVDYLIKIGLKTGNKVKQQVGVPDWISRSQLFSRACLRGLMDTDGGVFWHRYKVNGKSYAYKKICFSNRSLPLLTFVAETLKELRLTSKIAHKMETKHVWLYNKSEVEEYLRLIGTHNPRLLKQ